MLRKPSSPSAKPKKDKLEIFLEAFERFSANPDYNGINDFFSTLGAALVIFMLAGILHMFGVWTSMWEVAIILCKGARDGLLETIGFILIVSVLAFALLVFLINTRPEKVVYKENLLERFITSVSGWYVTNSQVVIRIVGWKYSCAVCLLALPFVSCPGY